MLLPDTIHPNLSIYYNASKVLEVLNIEKELNLLDLYTEIKAISDMGLPLLILCIDWLFLIDLINTNEDGKIMLCISKD